MSGYPPRKAGRANLVVGITLLLLALLVLLSVASNVLFLNNTFFSVMAIFVFVFMGGYEIGKYAENRITKQYRAQHDHKIS